MSLLGTWTVPYLSKETDIEQLRQGTDRKQIKPEVRGGRQEGQKVTRRITSLMVH